MLTEQAHADVLRALRSYGNDVGSLQATALKQLMAGMSRQGLGIERGRCAYGLPPGTGKTQSVIIWIAATWKLGLKLSVSVSAAHIEALCEIKRGLVTAGVPEHAIGLRHSHGARATEPDTGDLDRRIMLVSHSRMRGGGNTHLFSHHDGKPRDLLIWDETLMTTDAESLSWHDVKSACERLTRELPPRSKLSATLFNAVALLGHELESQECMPPSPSIAIPADDLEEAQAEARALGTWGTPLRTAAVKTVQSLLRMIERPVAIARTRSGASGDGVIRYTVAVDPGLTNIAVLDASHPIRILAKNGGIVDCTTHEMRECKSYEKVAVLEIGMAAGKTSLTDRGALSKVAACLAEEIRQIDASERVLIVTFKGDGAGLPLKLKTCLSSYEDINVAKEIDGKPWISFLTWGRETGLNTLRDCKHVILVGVLRRSPLDLAASAAAANEDLSYRLCNDRQREVATSEMAHCVLQAMNRGSCRVMSESGKADPMKLTIIAHAPGVKEALADVLPGVSWTRREAEYQPRANTQTSEVANAIAEFLCRLPSEQDSISIRALKAAVGGSLQRDSWRVALGIGLSLASLSLGIGEAHWEKVGQSLKRMR